MTTILNHGVYGFTEAARLTGLKRSRIREWFSLRSPERDHKPIFAAEYEPVEGNRAISFLDLIDVFVAGQLREQGVSLQTLRKVYQSMRVGLGTEHPFSRRELLSDGKKVFMRWADEEGRQFLEEVLSRCRAFPDLLLPFLKKIAYDEVSRLAKRWCIADLVVIDPTICFGKPIVEVVGIPTAILAAAYVANDQDAGVVADWYNVQKRYVMAAVDFEQRLAA
jgi:uncharacterized protein (DUF433 family)